jgi:hypothetical protein
VLQTLTVPGVNSPQHSIIRFDAITSVYYVGGWPLGQTFYGFDLLTMSYKRSIALRA